MTEHEWLKRIVGILIIREGGELRVSERERVAFEGRIQGEEWFIDGNTDLSNNDSTLTLKSPGLRQGDAEQRLSRGEVPARSSDPRYYQRRKRRTSAMAGPSADDQLSKWKEFAGVVPKPEKLP